MFEIGKSGYLPDISSSFAFWRTFVVNSLEKKNWDGAKAGLNSLNACLTDEYVITISTKEHDQALREQSYFQCGYCTMMLEEIVNKGEDDENKIQYEVPTEIPIHEVKIFDMILSPIEIVIRRSNTVKIWICPSCYNENKMNNGEWNTVTSRKEKPFYLKIVPDPPIKLGGIANRLGWDKTFSDWAYNFLEEIQVSMKFYRIEYIHQNGMDMIEDSSFKDKGDLQIAKH